MRGGGKAESTTEATVVDLPAGIVHVIPSHITRIPTFLLLSQPIFIFTLVSICISTGKPFFIFRPDHNLINELEPRSCEPDNTTRRLVWLFLSEVKAVTKSFPTGMELEKIVTKKGVIEENKVVVGVFGNESEVEERDEV
ncbi:hypothetical protein V8G54_020389 [Vigna mungo]|uniref:Uncharacterized protein n=1 Tax=Vigna mungo TaxID=3915 RepID=A0AAQ3NFD9_VIGMU